MEELDDVHEIINWSQIEQQLSHLNTSETGAKSYPPLIEPLLNLINDQLDEERLMITQGSISIIDASIVEAKQSRPKKNKEGKSTQDPDAAYVSKIGSDGKRKTTYGYKLHINCDEDGFIGNLEYTTANVHDSQVFKEILTGYEHEVYADSAYASQATDQLLCNKNKVLNRAYRNKPLSDEQKFENQQRSKTRSTVERVFGQIKLHQGQGKARYMGLARNKTGAMLLAMSHNIKCGMNIFKKYHKKQNSYV